MNMFAHLAVGAGRRYLRASPLEFGKWRIERALSHLLQASSLPPRLAKTRAGFLIQADLGDFIGRTVYITGEWDPHVGRVLEQRLKPGGVFIDGGANIGYFTLLASQCVGDAGQVLSFEPNPAAYARLQNNIALNAASNITALNVGLGAEAGTAVLDTGSEGNLGSASLRPGASHGEASIQIERLDDVVARRGLGRVSLVKLDIEGAEYAALLGMKSLLQRDRPDVVCEVSEWSLEKMGASREKLMSFMRELGYVPTVISKVAVSNLAEGALYFQFDVLFTHPGRI